MPINFQDIGVHKSVYSITFGRADVIMTMAMRSTGERMLTFYQTEDTSNPGKEIEYPTGTTTDDLPFPDLALIFKHPLDVALLIGQLLEIQKSMLV